MKDQTSLPALLAAKDWPAAERLLRRLAKGKAPQPAVFYNLAKVLVNNYSSSICIGRIDSIWY